MKLIKFSVIVFVLMVGPCMGQLEIANSHRGQSTSRLVNELGNILKCYYGDQIPGVGLAGNLASTLSRTLTVQHLIPVVLIDHSMKLNNMPRRLTNDFQYKLHVFIIEGSSENQLDDLIGKITFSVWWNHMASFFILDRSVRCANAKDFLLLAWKHDMLNAKVMCRPCRSERSIFNYNPFTSQAPVSWQRTAVFPAIHEHPFTLFIRKYKENETICADIDFDKTKELGRYRIRLIGHTPTHLKAVPLDARNEGWQHYTIRQNILNSVYGALNVTVTYNGYPNVRGARTNAEMIADTIPISNRMQYKMSYPTGIVGKSIATQFRNREPRQFDESFTVRGVDTRFERPIAYLITVLVLKFFVDQALVSQLLNIIRVTCKTRFINLRDINSMRVYLTDVGFFVVMMQAIFYASLTYPLTKQVPLRNVETMQDLADLNYTRVYGDPNNIDYYTSVEVFKDPSRIPEKVFEDPVVNTCLILVKKSRVPTACVYNVYYMLPMAHQLDLHLSRKLYATEYESFPMRSNWPLEERVNTMLARSVEANIMEPWYLKFNLTMARIVRKGDVEATWNIKNVESIKLGEITFVFIFLGIGHMCATVVLMIEFVCTYRLRCKIRFVRRYWHLERKKMAVYLKSTFD